MTNTVQKSLDDFLPILEENASSLQNTSVPLNFLHSNFSIITDFCADLIKLSPYFQTSGFMMNNISDVSEEYYIENGPFLRRFDLNNDPFYCFGEHNVQ